LVEVFLAVAAEVAEEEAQEQARVFYFILN
jgi:hypothetical protein